jgi:general secretion pathway protein I
MRSKNCYISDEAFTLIETLVAMMILSICLVVILQLFSGGLRAGRVSEDYTRAIFHAREKMEEFLLTKELANGLFEGEFDDGFRWTSKITYLEPEEAEKKPPVDMFNITIEISWDDGNRKKHFEISTLQISKLKTEN